MSDKNKLPDSVFGLDGSVSNEDLEKISASKETTESKSKNPWDKEFDDNLNDEGQPSRVAKNKKKRGVKTLVFGLFTALILLMFAPVIHWALESNAEPNANAGNNQVVSNDAKKVSDEKKAKQAKLKKEEAAKKAKLKEQKQAQLEKKQEQERQKAVEKLKADKQKAAQAAQEKEAQQNNQIQQRNNQNQQQTTQNEQKQGDQQSSSAGYYTVSAGENAYRIALNHNMTTEELYQLNGLQSGATITPGMQLRVK